MIDARIGRWGNSLAIRIPASVVKSRGFREGDLVKLEMIDENTVAVARRKNREKIIAQITAMKVPLPPDYKFDREEANARQR